MELKCVFKIQNVAGNDKICKKSAKTTQESFLTCSKVVIIQNFTLIVAHCCQIVTFRARSIRTDTVVTAILWNHGYERTRGIPR